MESTRLIGLKTKAAVVLTTAWFCLLCGTLYTVQHVLPDCRNEIVVTNKWGTTYTKMVDSEYQWLTLSATAFLIFINVSGFFGIMYLLAEKQEYDFQVWLDRVSKAKLLKTGLKK